MIESVAHTSLSVENDLGSSLLSSFILVSLPNLEGSTPLKSNSTPVGADPANQHAKLNEAPKGIRESGQSHHQIKSSANAYTTRN